MKNITNKTKTVLFASLIAAMLLPFGGMQFVSADSENNAEKIEQSIQELKSQKNSITGEISEDEIEQMIERLEIAKTLEILKSKGLQYSPQAQKLYLELRADIEGNFEPVEGKLVKEIPMALQSLWQYDTFATGLQVTFSCSQTMTGQTTGSLTQYDQVSYLVATPNYPSVFDCTKIHNETPVRVTDLSGSLLSTCNVDIPYASGVTAYVTCQDFGLHDDLLTTNVILVESNSFYENGWIDTPFTAYYGWTMIVY